MVVMEQHNCEGDIHLLVAAMVGSPSEDTPVDKPEDPAPPPPPPATSQPQVASFLAKRFKKGLAVRVRIKRDPSPDDGDDVLINRRKAFRRSLFRSRPGMANPSTGEGYLRQMARLPPPLPPLPPSPPPQPVELVSRECQTRPLAIPKIPVASRTFPAPWRRRIYMPISLPTEDALPYADDSVPEIMSSERILEGMAVVEDCPRSQSRTVATNTVSIGRRVSRPRRPRRRYLSRVGGVAPICQQIPPNRSRRYVRTHKIK
ncbi:myosin-1-like [Penaeus chinensis]|uniref:myosin-1-like n=1 Tax=Penaeus chinensis TaxID=139456 RepID=UPI001FB725F8|nr:myosin-1-like [Penaeus chinensis]